MRLSFRVFSYIASQINIQSTYNFMSWSINQSGKALEVISALTATASAMTEGQSKTEFAATIPSITGLVLAYPDLVATVDASGHGSVNADGKFIYNTVRVTVTHSEA